MGWSVSSFFFNIYFAVHWLSGYSQLKLMQFIDLDPNKWEDLKKGLNYDEAPVQPPNDNAHNTIAPVGLSVWFEMLKIFLLLVLVGILIWLIIRLISGTKFKRSTKKKKEDPGYVPIQKIPTALSPLEVLWKHFHGAQKAGDYRECLRILYQISLKKLSNGGWLKTKPDKTNYEYLTELSGKLPAADFAILTAIFEYSWYGDAPVKSSDFTKYEPQFMNFINRKDLEGQS